MTGRESEPATIDPADVSVDDSLTLVLRSLEGEIVKCLLVCADGSIKDPPVDDPRSFVSPRTVEIQAPVESTLSVGELLRRGDVRILKGAPLLREYSRLLRQAATNSGD